MPDVPVVDGLAAASSFDEASRLVLDYLVEYVPLGTWVVSRAAEGRQTYLAVAGSAAGGSEHGLERGGSHAWDDALCRHMVTGAAPRVAPDVSVVPLYAAAGATESLGLRAYAGAPVHDVDGSLFGTLCGLDGEVQPAALAAHAPLLDVLTRLLGHVLTAERRRTAAEEQAGVARSAATTDVLSGLLNRRGWDAVVETEQERHATFADPTVVVMVDLDGLKAINDGPGGHAAGDAYITAAGRALRDSVRADDTLARLGGDEFGIVLRQCPVDQAQHLVERLHRSLEEVGVAGSMGWAPLTVREGLAAALARADAAMYAGKRRRAGERATGHRRAA